MFERFRRSDRAREEHHDHRAVATAEREHTTAPPPNPSDRATGGDQTQERPFTREHHDTDNGHGTVATGAAAASTHEVVHDLRARQRDEFGGFNIGAAFFGWLVAIGLGALLTALLSAAGTAIGLTEGVDAGDAEKIGIGGGILFLCALLVAYFAGGYVAGRMSRFDGGRQGLGVWLFAVLATVIIGAVAAIAGSEYNLFEQLDLPRIPIDEGDLTTGGKTGERYHKKIDRVGYDL